MFRRRYSTLCLLIFAATVLLALGAGTAGPSVCLVRLVLRIPCPSCGMSRGVAALLHGNGAEAFSANPASLPVAAAAALLCLLWPIERIGEHRTLERLWARPGVRHLCTAGVVLLMTVAWAVNLMRHIHGGGPCR